jgi:hypothetical protein
MGGSPGKDPIRLPSRACKREVFVDQVTGHSFPWTFNRRSFMVCLVPGEFFTPKNTLVGEEGEGGSGAIRTSASIETDQL